MNLPETGLAGNPAAQAHSPASGSSPAAGSPPGSCLDGWGAPEAGSPGHLEGSQSYGIPPGCSSLASPGSCGIVPLGNPDNLWVEGGGYAGAVGSRPQERGSQHKEGWGGGS